LPSTTSPTTPTATKPTAKPGLAKRAESAANSTTGKPAAADPNRGEGAEKPSGKPDTAGKDQSGDSDADEPAKGKKDTRNE
jgi:hypothetical protein